MMAITHCSIAAAGTSLILGTGQPLPIGLAILGSQIPDIDTTTSTIGKIFYPISSWIEDRFPHRTITHSLLATVSITVVALVVNHFFLLGDIKIAIALPLGHLLSCFSDTFTKQGVQLFYPNPAWAISVSNPRRRLKTGGATELWVLGSAIALLCLGIYLANGGGITSKVGQSLGLRSEIIKIYNENSENSDVFADIKGYWANDRSSASGNYLILGTEGKEFILTNNKGIYKTGAQIIITKLDTKVSDTRNSKTKEISFNDENAVAKLSNFQQKHPEQNIYLSGELEVDFPEDIVLFLPPNDYQVASLQGKKIKFKFCDIDVAIPLLREQYGLGALEVRLIEK